ncbi:MAG: hypothetical protein IT378_27125 [Sandaracinaceae bacterium]|nr:hypothetical protein [Sandaracinaceae bacterium]
MGRHLLDPPLAENVGVRVRVPPGKHATLLDLRGEDEVPRAVSVVLTIEPVVADVAGLGPDELGRGEDVLKARARLEIGGGGHRLGFDVDVLRGMSFAVPASSLRVTVFNEGGADVELGAFAAYGVVPHAPRLTLEGPRLDRGAVWIVELPPFAQAVTLLAPIEAAWSLEIGLGRAGDRWLYGQQHLVLSQARPPALPIANGCSRARVTNLSALPFAPLAVCELAL